MFRAQGKGHRLFRASQFSSSNHHSLAWHIKDVPHNAGRDNYLKHLGHGGFSVPWKVMPAELVAWHPLALLSQGQIFSTA